MDYSHQTSLVPCGQDKYISKNELLLHLKTYNLYYEGQNLQLRHREEEDDNERIRPPPSSSSWHSGCNLGAQGTQPSLLDMLNVLLNSTAKSIFLCSGEKPTSWPDLGADLLALQGRFRREFVAHPLRCCVVSSSTILKPLTVPNIQISEADAPPESEQTSSPADSRGLKTVQEDTPQLMRTRSDVGVRRRGNVRTPSDQRRIRRHRFSINGHFYNHKTSVFTPAYGSVTNVRINSTMTTPQVLKLLLNKFKIENSAEEFALYVVHTSGEKQKLKNTDYPLVARILQGPCEQVSKVFLMEKDQVEEVTYDVAQYIKFEMPVLKSFIQKLQEEEDREVKKLMRKYTVLRLMIRQRLEEMAETPATI
uniref:Ras association domain family member 2 n=1 Tax=Suricata suricatta TaxID=37032 RepID=A0A673TPQ5_SURSU